MLKYRARVSETRDSATTRRKGARRKVTTFVGTILKLVHVGCRAAPIQTRLVGSRVRITSGHTKGTCAASAETITSLIMSLEYEDVIHQSKRSFLPLRFVGDNSCSLQLSIERKGNRKLCQRFYQSLPFLEPNSSIVLGFLCSRRNKCWGTCN